MNDEISDDSNNDKTSDNENDESNDINENGINNSRDLEGETYSLKNELPKNCKPLIVKNVLISTSIVTSKFYPDSVNDNFDNEVKGII